MKRTIFSNPKAPPKVGDEIYVNSAMYLSHGMDDFDGGLVEVTKVTFNEKLNGGDWHVEVKERPGHKYSWSFLAEKQTKLFEEYKNERGKPCPDDTPEFNMWD